MKVEKVSFRDISIRNPKNWVSAFACVILLCSVGTLCPQERSQLQLSEESLTLEKSLNRAFINNPELLAAQQELEISKANLYQARSLFFPNLNFQTTYIRHRHETLGVTSPELGGVVIEAPITQTTGNRSNPLSENLYLGRLGFQQTLWAGGRVKSAYRLSQVKLKKSQSEYDFLKREIEYNTKDGFYSLLASRRKLEVLNKGLAEITVLGKGIKNSHSNLALAFAKSNLRKKKAQIEKEEKEAKTKYLRATGLEIFTEVKVEGSLEVPSLNMDLQRILAQAKQNRPDLRQTQIDEEVDQLSVRLSMAERYPVFIFGGAYELRNSKFPLDETNWNAALSMNIPIFSGFASLARIKASRHKAKQGRYQRVQLEDQIESEVRSAYEDVLHWEAELETRKQELGFLQNQRTRYSQDGSGNSFSERLEYFDWDLSARLSVTEAQHQLVLARARLERAIGLPLT